MENGGCFYLRCGYLLKNIFKMSAAHQNNEYLDWVELQEHFVTGSGTTGSQTRVSKIVALTESEYNALITKDPAVFYVVLPDSN